MTASRDDNHGGSSVAFELTHARHDPVQCLAPGLFRSVKRGERKKLKLDVTYRYGENEQVRFVGFEVLGADDMRLLQTLVALAGPRGIALTANPTDDLPQQLRLSMEPTLDAMHQECLFVAGKLGNLLAEGGLTDGGDNFGSARASLIRMSNVTLIINRGSRVSTAHLMSHTYNKANDDLSVCLHPGIADAVLGRKPYSRIELAEVRLLSTDPARLVHQRLCGWIDPGKSGRAVLDTICGYIWPEEANSETMKKRRMRARKALCELASLGWSIEQYAKGKWDIRRPSVGLKEP